MGVSIYVCQNNEGEIMDLRRNGGAQDVEAYK